MAEGDKENVPDKGTACMKAWRKALWRMRSLWNKGSSAGWSPRGERRKEFGGVSCGLRQAKGEGVWTSPQGQQGTILKGLKSYDDTVERFVFNSSVTWGRDSCHLNSGGRSSN